jgi:hypothetical protein
LWGGENVKIRIRKDAAELYIQEHTDWNGTYNGKDKWERALKKLAGKIIEVDTEMLFKHEFNTKPIPGITKKGIRIMEEYVEEVIDDERKGKAYCELCNKVSNSVEVCPTCGKSEYLEPFFDEYT